jgi:ABC-type transporter Mla MlaB component
MAVDGPESRTVSLQGPVTIYEVAGIRATLRDALNQPCELHIDLGESGKWDLAGLQLIISCVNTGSQLGRRVRLSRVPAACREVANRSGLAEWLDSVAD